MATYSSTRFLYLPASYVQFTLIHACICFCSNCDITHQAHPGPELACFVVDHLLQAQYNSAISPAQQRNQPSTTAQSAQHNGTNHLKRAHHSSTTQAKADRGAETHSCRASSTARCVLKTNDYIEIFPPKTYSSTTTCRSCA